MKFRKTAVGLVWPFHTAVLANNTLVVSFKRIPSTKDDMLCRARIVTQALCWDYCYRRKFVLKTNESL